MGKSLLSVGLDVGTTTTQLIVSRLEVENRASSFAVPELTIAQRRVLYQSPVTFTPLLGGELVDGEGIRKIVELAYRDAGVRREDVDTGAIIITGETSRKENAAAVLSALSDFAGEFVVATAGPDLESVLSAKGAGAVDFSRRTGKTVLHMDIGGGTSNLTRIEAGEITGTTCLNVGGRLLKLDEQGVVTYVSPAVRELTPIRVGDTASAEAVAALAKRLTLALEAAAFGGTEASCLRTAGSGEPVCPVAAGTVISFSGGVADCIETDRPDFAFGDMGPALGRAIRASRLCQGAYMLGSETIRATVIGAGCHSAQLSGSTVYYRNVGFPLKNLPVARAGRMDRDGVAAALRRMDGVGVLVLPYTEPPGYEEIRRIADLLAALMPGNRVLLAMEADMAKALGQALALRLPEAEILSLDRVRLSEGSYLDVGEPVGPALPVVVKTLILSR